VWTLENDARTAYKVESTWKHHMSPVLSNGVVSHGSAFTWTFVLDNYEVCTTYSDTPTHTGNDFDIGFVKPSFTQSWLRDTPLCSGCWGSKDTKEMVGKPGDVFECTLDNAAGEASIVRNGKVMKAFSFKPDGPLRFAVAFRADRTRVTLVDSETVLVKGAR